MSNRPWKTSYGWYTEDYNDKVIGPFRTENEAWLAPSLGESVEDLTLSMIEEGLVTDDDGVPLKPSDFRNWPKSRKRT